MGCGWDGDKILEVLLLLYINDIERVSILPLREGDARMAEGVKNNEHKRRV